MDNQQQQGAPTTNNGKEIEIVEPKKRPIYAPGWYKEITNEDYHNSLGYGSTTLKILTEKTYAHLDYKRKNPEPSDTTALLTGQALHTLAMEPHKFDLEFAVRPPNLKRPTKAQLNAKKPSDASIALIQENLIWEEKRGKRTEITEEMFEHARAMAKRLREHPQTGLYFEEGVAEQSIYYWYNPEDWDKDNDYRIMCKVRPDWIIPGHSVLFDLKTTRDASQSDFAKQIKNLKYHLSAAMYLDGVNRCHDFLDFAQVTGFLDFVWICVENEPPYEVASYEMTQKVRDEGEALYHGVVRKLHQYKMSDWKGYGAMSDKGVEPITRPIDIPTWGNPIV